MPHELGHSIVEIGDNTTEVRLLWRRRSNFTGNYRMEALGRQSARSMKDSQGGMYDVVPNSLVDNLEYFHCLDRKFLASRRVDSAHGLHQHQDGGDNDVLRFRCITGPSRCIPTKFHSIDLVDLESKGIGWVVEVGVGKGRYFYEYLDVEEVGFSGGEHEI